MLLARLYVRGDILLTRDLHDSIISLRGEVWAHQTSLATPLFIEVYAPIQDIQRTYICVLASFHDFDV